MSRALVITGVLIALIGAELASAARESERAGVAPALRLVRVQPFTVAGTGFMPRESVRVTVVREGENPARALRASSTGSFVVSFGELKVRRCAALMVRACGARGSRAILKLAQPACTPD